MAGNYTIRIASSRDGVGKTTVAVNLALALASFGKKVLLMDANLVDPSVMIQLGMKEIKTTFRDIFYYKLDVHMAIMNYAPGNIDVIPNRPTGSFAPMADQLRSLGEQVANVSYDFIIVDTSTSYYSPMLTLYYDESIVVTNPDESLLESTMRLEKLYDEAKIKYTVVLNKVTGAEYEIKKEELEKILSKRIAATLPDEKDMQRYLGLHKPIFLGNKDSAFSIAIKELAKGYMK